MAIFLERPVKGKRFTQEFDVNDAADQILPKVGPGTIIGEAIAGATPIATDTVQGKVALNLGNTLPSDSINAADALTASGATNILNDTSVTGGNAVQKAVVNAVEQALVADTGAQAAIAELIKDEALNLFPVATDTVQGKVALNLGTALPGDAANSTDALTAAGLASVLNDASLSGGNAVQQAVVNAVERSLLADTGAQEAIAAALKDDLATAIATDASAINAIADGLRSATDTVKGVVTLAVATNFPSASDVEATTPAYVSQVVTNAVSGIPVIADATDTVKGKVSLAVAANFPSNSDTEATTPAYVQEVVDTAMASGAISAATDTVQGKVALNLGTALPGDTTNTTDALTASGFNAMANASGAANAVQQAVVNAVQVGIGADPGATQAIVAAIAADPVALAALKLALGVDTDIFGT